MNKWKNTFVLFISGSCQCLNQGLSSERSLLPSFVVNTNMKKNKTTYSYVNVQTVSHDVVRKKQVKSCSPLHKPAPMPKRKDSR